MHEIVITVSGAWTRGTESGVKIISPPRGRLETIFHEAQFPSERASELAGQGAHSLATLKRYMRGLGTLPPYANWPNARAMAQASILGKWKNDNEADRAAIEQFLGKSYGEWMETIRNESLRADAPLIQRNELWKVIGRGEAWSALGPRLSNEDLDRVTELAIAVLGGIDPEFSLEKEERYAAALSGQRRAHSKSLREGLTETLALLGTKGRSLVSTTQGKAEATAYIVVRKLLEDAPWERWAGMNDELPALAEASPDSFLNAVESVLNVPGDCPFLRVFQQEGAGFGGRTYISGLLWALETLAWDPKYIGRATLALGELAAMDPGGNFGNRPAGSLTDIYLPWHVQTLADLQQSKSALEALIRDQPIVGWKLLLSLLPSHHGSTTGTRKPIWRRIVPDGWTVNTSRVAYGERVQLYAALCIDLASQDVAKLIELTGRIENLPEPAHSQLLNYLSEPRNSLDEEERLSLWTILTELVRKHQRYAGANWAAPPDIVQKWISAADRLRPPSDAMTSRQLFSNSDYNLYEDDESLEAAHIRLVGMRQAIALRIFGSRGIDGLLEFAGQLEVPAKLGEAFGLIENVKADPLVLPALLMAPDKPIRAFAGAYVWARWVKGGIAWLDQQLASKWTDEENLQLLLRLPSLPDIWFRAEATLPDRGQEYWRRVGVNPYPLEIADLPLVAEKLLKNGQASSAVDCLFVLAHKKGTVSGDLAYRTFVSAFSDPGQTPPFNTHHIEQIIEALQRTEPLDSEVLFRVEWLCLPFLNRLHNNRPRALEHRLASSPSFFVEVVSAIFRRHGEGDEVESAPTEAEKNLASSAFSLLNGWSQTPGQLPNGEFDGAKFEAWLDEVKALSRQAGRFGGAMNQIGHMLALAKERAEGELWIHPTIAAALDAKDAKEMRDGFTVGLFNRRGVHGFTQGKEELAIAKSYRDKAAALRLGSFHRIAGAVDQLASSYEKDGESQRGRDFLDDL